MRKIISILNLTIFSTLLPCLYGCQGGGSSEISALGSSGSAALTSNVASLPLAGSSSGQAIATIHNPEPTTLLLIGSGMLAMSFLKKK